MFEYRRENDQYSFYANGNLLFSTEEVAVAYNEDQRSIVLKHGPAGTIQHWAAMYRTLIGAVGASDSMRLSVISSREWDVEELNKVINTTGYLDIFLTTVWVKEREKDRQDRETQTNKIIADLNKLFPN